MAATKRDEADRLIAQLDKALAEQATLWKTLKIDGGYELLNHARPTDRDLEMEIRRQMKSDYPEVIRWRLAFLLGRPLEHE